MSFHASLCEQFQPASVVNLFVDSQCLTSSNMTLLCQRLSSRTLQSTYASIHWWLCLVLSSEFSAQALPVLQVQACELAKNCHSKVQHPLLDKVRQCSANPEQVARFFEEILSPIPHVRVEAISQAWCADAVTQMFTESGTSYDSSATEADLQTEAGLCTTLFGCFACGSPQRRRRRCSMQPSNRVAKLASKLDFFKRPRGKPSAPSKPCSSEAKALQADSKQAANVSSKKGCLSWVKNGYCTFRSRSKQPSPHVAEQLAPPSATELRLLMDVDSTSAASYTPSRPGHSSSAAAGLSSTGDRLEAPAVSMTAVAGVDLRPQLQQQPVHNQTGAHETTQNKPQPCLRVPGIGDDQLTHDAAGGETGRNVLAKDDLKKSAVGVDRCGHVVLRTSGQSACSFVGTLWVLPQPASHQS